MAGVLGAIGIVAGAAQLVVSWQRSTILGANRLELYLSLRDKSRIASDLMEDYIIPDAQRPGGGTKAELTRRASALAKDLHILLSDLGYEPPARRVYS
jgi:hypothetical protein